ncbi:MAG TPA: cupin domain-containing protein [Bryobacteraceae bacterium]|jgi:mannose-6-phosphate isomerase-like protein (cupin superfamily)|nr:cupin domain-containing protein [Bryobacteraceae bacterium]
MPISRRELNLLLPALAAAAAQAQPQKAPVPTMTSKAYPTGDFPYKGNDTKRSRQFFLAQTHAGFKVEMHETNLGPGIEAHPPHKHIHEEIMVVTEGSLEANMDGVKTTVPAGSVLVFGSNRMHNVRNPGTVMVKYYVIELRGMDV